jgi:hypothetical protein
MLQFITHSGHIFFSYLTHSVHIFSNINRARAASKKFLPEPELYKNDAAPQHWLIQSPCCAAGAASFKWSRSRSGCGSDSYGMHQFDVQHV